MSARKAASAPDSENPINTNPINTNTVPEMLVPIVDAMTALNGDGFDAVARMNKEILAYSCATIDEIAELATKRLDEHAKDVKTLSNCNDYVETFQAQARIGQKMLQDNAETFSRLSGHMAKHTQEFWKPWQAYNQACISAISRAVHSR